jgi:hypothetical protein
MYFDIFHFSHMKGFLEISFITIGIPIKYNKKGFRHLLAFRYEEIDNKKRFTLHILFNLNYVYERGIKSGK